MYNVIYQYADRESSPWRKAALIGGAGVAGALLGMRTIPRMIKRGRVLEKGESTLGKIVFTDQGLTTPLELFGKRHRWENRAAKGSKLAKAVVGTDSFFGLPQRHFGIGAGGGRIIEKTKSHGIRVLPEQEFARGSRIRVDSEVPLKTDAEISGFNDRYEKLTGAAKRGDLNLITNNCEHFVRGLAGQGRKSFQTRAIVGGAVGGGTLGAGGVGGALYLRNRRSRTSPASVMPRTPTR